MTTQPLYRHLATALSAADNYRKAHNDEWLPKHLDAALALTRDHMPSGSGFDNGTKLDLARSHAKKLVFTTAFHHVDEGGSYDGWTEHTVTVRLSSVFGISLLTISGRNRNQIKNYIADTFQAALTGEVDNAKAYGA